MPEDTRTRILDAALETLTLFGLSRVTLADVAKRAALSRQTLYRYFPTRDDLVAAVVAREEQALVELVAVATEDEDDLEASIERALVVVIRTAADHPLLKRLIELEPPDGQQPFIDADQAPVLRAARPALASVLASGSSLDEDEVDVVADALTRLLISWIVSPPPGGAEANAQIVARLAARATGPGLPVDLRS